MKIKTIIINSVLLAASSFSSGQSRDFHIYVRQGMYNIDDYFSRNKVFKYYNILGENFIDPKKTGSINKESVCKGIELLYPNRNAVGYLVIDIENKVASDFKNYSIEDSQYLDAASSIEDLVSMVRSLRPGLKIALYGLPYRVYYESQSKWNDERKLGPLLSLCDFLAPSLYLLYSNRERGIEANELYLRRNLKTALEYGCRLKKPVIPFIWYAVSPGNRLYGGEILDKKEVLEQITLIRDFSLKGEKAAGVIWWEPSDNAFRKLIKLNPSVRMKSQITKDKNVIIQKYTEPFLK